MTTLRDLREENEKTLAEVASVLGVSVQSAYRYEQGIRRLSLDQVLKLSELYHITAEEIIKAQINSCRNVQ